MKKYGRKIMGVVLIITMLAILLIPDNGYAQEDRALFDVQGTTVTGYHGTGENIQIPSGITAIAANAFAGNDTITSVTIPAEVKQIGNGAFSKCTKLTNVELKGKVELGTRVFSGCDALSSVSFADGTTNLPEGMFYNCGKLTDVTLPDSLTTIGENAFSNCKSLTGISFPTTVSNLGDGAFSGCTSLNSVVVPGGKLGNGVFSGCTDLSSVGFLDTVESIGNMAFEGCNSLPEITIPEGVTSIGSEAFANCKILNSVSVPSTVTSIAKDAFSNSKNLETIEVKEGNSGYSSINGCLYNESGDTLICCPEGKGTVELADTLKVIGNDSFSGCMYLDDVVIPSQTETIESNAFADSGIKRVTIPQSVTAIGSQENWTPDVIYGYKGSEAEKFASENEYIFESIDSGDKPSNPSEPDAPSKPQKPSTSQKPSSASKPTAGSVSGSKPVTGSNSNSNQNNQNTQNGGGTVTTIPGGTTTDTTGNGTTQNGTVTDQSPAQQFTTVRPVAQTTAAENDPNRAKDVTPKTADTKISPKYMLCISVMMFGVYLLLTKKKM